MWTRAFWKDTFERTVRTIAAALAASFGADRLGVLDVDWAEALNYSGMTGLVTVLLALAGGAKGNPDNASFLPTVPAPRHVVVPQTPGKPDHAA